MKMIRSRRDSHEKELPRLNTTAGHMNANDHAIYVLKNNKNYILRSYITTYIIESRLFFDIISDS